MILKIALIRAGYSQGEQDGRRLGRLNEPLSPEAERELVVRAKQGAYPWAEVAYTSPMQRSVTTANIIFKNIEIVTEIGLSPLDLGQFAGMSNDEIQGDPRFAQWGKSRDAGAFPGGEEPYLFQLRCVQSFKRITNELTSVGVERAALVTHNEVINTLLKKFTVPKRTYADWTSSYGKGFFVAYDTHLSVARVLAKI